MLFLSGSNDIFSEALSHLINMIHSVLMRLCFGSLALDFNLPSAVFVPFFYYYFFLFFRDVEASGKILGALI